MSKYRFQTNTLHCFADFRCNKEAIRDHWFKPYFITAAFRISSFIKWKIVEQSQEWSHSTIEQDSLLTTVFALYSPLATAHLKQVKNLWQNQNKSCLAMTINSQVFFSIHFFFNWLKIGLSTLRSKSISTGQWCSSLNHNLEDFISSATQQSGSEISFFIIFSIM